jgi:hypothetical protein
MNMKSLSALVWVVVLCGEEDVQNLFIHKHYFSDFPFISRAHLVYSPKSASSPFLLAPSPDTLSHCARSRH